MKLEDYKKAHKLQEEISRLKYELNVLQEHLDTPTTIRFGTNFNVSIPIQFDLENYKKCLEIQMLNHQHTINKLTTQFEAL